MKKVRLILMLAAGMFVATSCNDDDDENVGTTLPEADRMFVNNAADGGMFEVKAGELAVAKGDSSKTGMVMGSDSLSIKSFGQMMITDHTKANNELKTLADQEDVDLPSALSTAKQKMLDSLSAASGATFNMMYVRMMVTSHQETVSLFEKQANTGQDPELKSWASQKLPTLKHHLEMAEMLHNEIK
jgi:putative membrane protein